MTLNSLDSSTLFTYQNKTAAIPEGHTAPAGDRNQATMDSDQIASVVHAPHQSGHLPVTQVMYLCYTSIGLNPPVTSIKN